MCIESRLQALLNMLIGLSLVGLGLLSVDTIRTLTDIATHAKEGSIIWTAVVLGAVFLLEMLMHIASTWISAVLGVRTQNLMQQFFFRRLIKGKWHGIEKFHSGDVINRLFGDVGDIVDLMTDVLPHLLLYLGGISTPLYREELNVISPNYDTKRPRILKGETDYNQLKK